MDHPLPIVRHCIPCSDILYSHEFPRRATLLYVLSSIEPTDLLPYPYHCRQLCLFAQLSNGRGSGEIQVVIRRADDDIIVHKSPVWPIAFSADPLEVVGVPIRIHDVLFPEPGMYLIELMYENQVLKDLTIICR